MHMQNETAIITGGTSGIGKRIAEHFLSEGCKVVIGSRNREHVETTVNGFKERFGDRIAGFPCDVSDLDSVKTFVGQAVEVLGSVRILIANAGWVLTYGPFQYIPLDQLERYARKTIDTNLIGMINTVAAVLPHMLQQKYGRIITLSGGGADRPLDNMTLYSASKGGVIAFTKCLALELKNQKLDITINVYNPGMTRTGLMASPNLVPGWRDEADVSADVELVLKYIGADINQTTRAVIPYVLPSNKKNGTSFIGFSVIKLIRGVGKMRSAMKKRAKEQAEK
jgi:NAD(P)-dependent dehydrogenase (short-subunit alcohol dehydrogenase family)